MADDWETENGLNPADPEDRNGGRNQDGYTNLEEYLYSLVPGMICVEAMDPNSRTRQI